MELFENVLILEFKEKYKDYCDSIRNNIVSAIYDIEFLKNIEQYTVRLKVLESTSSKLLNHIIRMFWQDLILNITKILEKKGKDLKSIYRFSSDIKLNAVQNIQISKIKLDNNLVNKIRKCRTHIFAHSLFNVEHFIIRVSEIESIISSVLQSFNNLQFQVDNTNFYLSNEEIQQIKLNCINGINGLIKPSIFANI